MLKTKTDYSLVKKKDLEIDDCVSKSKKNRIIVITKSKSNEKPIDELIKIFDPNNSRFPKIKFGGGINCQAAGQAASQASSKASSQVVSPINRSNNNLQIKKNKKIILPKLTLKIKEGNKNDIITTEVSGERYTVNIRNIKKIKSMERKTNLDTFSSRSSIVNPSKIEQNLHDENSSYMPKSYKQNKKERVLSNSEQLYSDIYGKQIIQLDNFAKIYHNHNDSISKNKSLINNSMVYALNKNLQNMNKLSSSDKKFIKENQDNLQIIEFPLHNSYSQNRLFENDHSRTNKFYKKITIENLRDKIKMRKSPSFFFDKIKREGKNNILKEKILNLEFKGKDKENMLTQIFKKKEDDPFQKKLFSKIGILSLEY